MCKQRFIYSGILLAGVLATALALFFFRTSLQGPSSTAGLYPHEGIAISNRAQDGVPAARSDREGEGSPSQFKPPSKPARDHVSDNSSFILNVLSSSKKKEAFGFFRLIGITFFAAAPAMSSAVISDVSTGERHIVHVDDLLSDLSRIVDIQQHYIVLEKEGVRRKLTLYSYESTSTNNTPFGNPPEKFKKVSDNEWVLKPYQVFQGDVNDVLDFSLDMHSRDGRVDGIRIVNVHPHSLAGELGLKEGDVLAAVNGQTVDSLYDSVKACFDARMSDELALKIRRGGNFITLKYHLLWEGNGMWGTRDVLRSRAVLSLINRGFITNLF